MIALWLLAKKNLKLLIRSKGSALVVVFAPLLIMLTLGLSFNTSNSYGINIGVYAASFTDEVKAFMQSLQDDGFRVVEYTSSEECVEDIKQGFAHTCVTVPESFAVEGNTAKEIIFYVDPSRINLVWMIQETMNTKLNVKSQQISQTLATDVLSRLSDTKGKIAAEKEKVTSTKDKNSQASSSSEGVRSSLSALDVSVPATAYDLATKDRFEAGMNAQLDEAIAKVKDAQSSLGAVNGSGKGTIVTSLDAAAVALDSAKVLMVNQSDSSLLAVSNLITALSQDVEATKAKLTTASTAILSSTTSLGEVSALLTDSVSSLEGVQGTMDQIISALDAQKTTDASVISTPLQTKIERINAGGTYLNYLFPALLVLVIMFTSLLLGTTLVMMEKTSPAYMRNFFLPVSKMTFVLATYVTNLILISIQVIVLLGISLFFLEDILLSLPLMALILFIAASVFTFLGMAVGYLFTSEETAVLGSISLGSLLLFVSGVILPIESISPMLRDITSFNPFVLSEKLIREVFIFQSGIQQIWVDLLILVGYAFFLFLFIMMIESLLHERLLNRTLHQHHTKHRDDQRRRVL